MRRLTTAVATLSAAVTLFTAAPSDACTNPESGSGNPTVTGQPGNDPSGGSTTPGSGTPLVEDGTPTGTSTPAAGTGGSGGTATPSSGEVLLDTGFVEVAWTPGNEVDGNPNNTAFYSHTGHRIATRVQVTDVTTHQVVMEETVAQYDYAHTVKGGSNPTLARLSTKLEPGRYEVRVQSVFSRHDEIRYGLDGSWQRTSNVTSPPAISSSVPAAKIYIPAGVDQGGRVAVQGGCSATGGALSGMWLLVLLFSARRRG